MDEIYAALGSNKVFNVSLRIKRLPNPTVNPTIFSNPAINILKVHW